MARPGKPAPRRGPTSAPRRKSAGGLPLTYHRITRDEETGSAEPFPLASAARFPSSMFRDKVRLRFRKQGGLRLVSHHDLMRCFERMLRRAGLPFRSTSGFHPKPRIVFALSLPLGVAGLDEVVELELNAELPVEEIHDRLARQAPPGLEILSVRRIDPRRTAQVRRVTYRLPIPAERAADLSRRLSELLAAAECWVERGRPEKKRVNIRPYLIDLRLRGGALEMELAVTPTGTARADDLVKLLELQDLIEAGAVLERARVELHDESVVASGEWPAAGEGSPSASRGPLAAGHS